MIRSSLLSILVLLAVTTLFGQPIPPPYLRITEVMYNSPGTSDSLDFVELKVEVPGSPFPIDGFSFTSGIEFDFYPGVTASNGDFIIVAKDSLAFENTFGVEAFQWTGTSLSDVGDSVAVIHVGFGVYNYVVYLPNAPWPNAANGNGASLILCESEWQASQNNTGTVVDGITIHADPGQPSVCLAVGNEEQQDSRLVSIYPNPATTNLTIESSTPLSQVWVRDVAGRAIMKEALRSAQSDTRIDVSSLPSGIYLVEVLTQNSQRSMQKVVVE